MKKDVMIFIKGTQEVDGEKDTIELATKGRYYKRRDVLYLSYEEMDVVALKSSQHFKGWWTGRAQTIISCDSPGIQGADLTAFDYKYANTGYFPLGDPTWE